MHKVERILIIHPHLNIKGGSERFTKVLAEELLRQGYEVAIETTTWDEEWFGRLRVVWYRLSPDALDKRKHVLEFTEYVAKDFQPDIVIVALQDPYYAYAIKRVRDVPVGLYVHTPYDDEITEENLPEYERHFRFPLDAPKYLKYADVIFVNSDYIRLIVKQIWNVEPIVVYPAIDRFFLEDVPEGLDEREDAFLYVGRFVHLKRQDFLILSFKLVRREFPNARLILAGFKDPRHLSYFNRIVELASEIGDVEIHISPNDEELKRLYRRARVYVHVRVGEHFGLSPIEAMRQGAIVVQKAPSGLAKLMRDGIDGFIAYNDYDVHRLMIKALRLEKGEAERIWKNAVEFSSRFNPANMTRAILEALLRRR